MYLLTHDLFIDTSLITCAEYQLFIDEMRARGKYVQPDHWNLYRFPSGQAELPILGVRSSDAISFCEWLSQREDGKWLYRLPLTTEANACPLHKKTNDICGYWALTDDSKELSILGCDFENLPLVVENVRFIDIARFAANPFIVAEAKSIIDDRNLGHLFPSLSSELSEGNPYSNSPQKEESSPQIMTSNRVQDERQENIERLLNEERDVSPDDVHTSSLLELERLLKLRRDLDAYLDAKTYSDESSKVIDVNDTERLNNYKFLLERMRMIRRSYEQIRGLSISLNNIQDSWLGHSFPSQKYEISHELAEIDNLKHYRREATKSSLITDANIRAIDVGKKLKILFKNAYDLIRSFVSGSVQNYQELSYRLTSLERGIYRCYSALCSYNEILDKNPNHELYHYRLLTLVMDVDNFITHLLLTQNELSFLATGDKDAEHKRLQIIIDFLVQGVSLILLHERIVGRYPAFEGIRIVKERKQE